MSDDHSERQARVNRHQSQKSIATSDKSDGRQSQVQNRQSQYIAASCNKANGHKTSASSSNNSNSNQTQPDANNIPNQETLGSHSDVRLYQVDSLKHLASKAKLKHTDKILILYRVNSSDDLEPVATSDENCEIKSLTPLSSSDRSINEKINCVQSHKNVAISTNCGNNKGECQRESHHSEATSSVSRMNRSPLNNLLTNVIAAAVRYDESVRMQRRTRIPDKPNYSLNLWSIMKHFVGKELTKIPMPVNFSEPLSMLQRLTEDYEYADVLDKAADCTDSFEQLAYVAAFTVSSYSTTSSRTGKPFNPLLGETYECDRRGDLGWRAISEQVSHHPPTVAQFCEGREWRCWQEFTMETKFCGTYLQITPLGTAHLEFNKTGNHYSWSKVVTTVHNIIVGSLWLDQSGDMEIMSHNNGAKCLLKYIPYSYFSKDLQRKVKGSVIDQGGNVKWLLSGTWDSKIQILPASDQHVNLRDPEIIAGPSLVVWQKKALPEGSERFYNFTELACQLNEPEEGVAPTDSRNRPDQRLMEEGRWDEANTEKLRLEEKQRLNRRMRESDASKASGLGQPSEDYEPVWFKKMKEPVTGKMLHMYQGEYWTCKEQQDWSRCPDIF